ncbi:hypothetical protein [Enterobacter oligotrophicus]|uniref:hypothetical protein n=1 Tax=Enterobacter oligotrophicus TaxID=2478464 RepID=UPI00035E1C3C|nr:hypothetical protein [Enterobacter oligotrophicus]
MKKIWAVILLSFFLIGCVQPMTRAEVEAATYEPLPQNYKDEIKQIMTYRLKDAESAKYNFFEPRKGYTASTRHFGYVVPVGINAKNSYGGYTGFQVYYFVYYQNMFKDVTDGVQLGAVKWSEDVR